VLDSRPIIAHHDNLLTDGRVSYGVILAHSCTRATPHADYLRDVTHFRIFLASQM